MTETKEIRVVAAAVTDNHRVLAAKRGQGRVLAGCFEFAGGKVEPDETDEVALVREIKEELNVVIRVGRYLGESVHGPIRLVLYVCEIVSGELVALEHEELRWLAEDEFYGDGMEWAPADIPLLSTVPAVLLDSQ